MSYYQTYKSILECCSKGHKTLEKIEIYVNKGKRGKARQSITAISARRRDPIIKDLIITDYFPGDYRGHYIAISGALTELDRRYGVGKKAA